MNIRTLPDNRLVIHLAALLFLMAVHFLADYEHFQQREGFYKLAPYFFLLLLYGWIIFHNLILFDGLFLKGRRRAYFSWTSLAMLVSSLNMYLILKDGFRVGNPLPQILNFWIYTLLGLGLYMTYRYLADKDKAFTHSVAFTDPEPQMKPYFEFFAEGEAKQISFEKIIYLESLENYVKIHTSQKFYLVRLPLKEAEQRLPSPHFIRISRSHILNTDHIRTIGQDFLRVGEHDLRIGKVYKKYVADQLLIRQQGVSRLDN